MDFFLLLSYCFKYTFIYLTQISYFKINISDGCVSHQQGSVFIHTSLYCHLCFESSIMHHLDNGW